MIQKLLLAKPRGFCAGVARAIDVVDQALEMYGAPVYVKHAIVHNIHVLEDLEKKGAIFTEDLEEIPEGSLVVFSAHGSPPEQYAQAEARNLTVIDAACPLVNKVHLEAKLFTKKGLPIVYVGHRGHPEAIGVEGEVKVLGGKFHLIDNLAEAEAFNYDQQDVAILSQTTLSLDDTKDIMAVLASKFPKATYPPKKDICYATENRQQAVRKMAGDCDVIFVIGSKTSSNSNRLREVAESLGVQAHLIDDASEIKPTWTEEAATVGISAGASAPEYLIEEVKAHFMKDNPEMTIEEVTAVQENVFFPLPKEVQAGAPYAKS